MKNCDTSKNGGINGRFMFVSIEDFNAMCDGKKTIVDSMNDLVEAQKKLKANDKPQIRNQRPFEKYRR
jgi:iron uptake system EfeUOB component EfeO/EfeM